MLNVMVAENNTNDQYATLVDPATRQYKTSNEMSIEFEVDGPYKVDLSTQHHCGNATCLLTSPQALLHSHDPSDSTEILSSACCVCLSTRMVLCCVLLEAGNAPAHGYCHLHAVQVMWPSKSSYVMCQLS
jgi:hypothetical protein